MPKLGVQTNQTLYLPSTKDAVAPEDKAWAKINSTIRVADIEKIEDYHTEIDQSAYALSQLIIEWNLEEENSSEIAAITPENVKKLPMQDFNYLGTWLQANVKDQTEGVPTTLKGTSSDT